MGTACEVAKDDLRQCGGRIKLYDACIAIGRETAFEAFCCYDAAADAHSRDGHGLALYFRRHALKIDFEIAAARTCAGLFAKRSVRQNRRLRLSESRRRRHMCRTTDNGVPAVGRPHHARRVCVTRIGPITFP
jgi:hypothetical protein